jgi:hypothetical protein
MAKHNGPGVCRGRRSFRLNRIFPATRTSARCRVPSALQHHAAIVAWACSLHGPRSPVGETQRIHT